MTSITECPHVCCDMIASVIPTGSMFLYVVQMVTREMSKVLGVLR